MKHSICIVIVLVAMGWSPIQAQNPPMASPGVPPKESPARDQGRQSAIDLQQLCRQGINLLEQHQYQKAVQILKRAAQQAQPPWLLVNLALAHRYLAVQAGQVHLQQAYKLANQALQKPPWNVYTLALIGRVALALRKYAVAIRALRYALKQQPDSPCFYIWLAQAYQGVGDYELMIRMARQARRRAPLLVDAYALLQQGYTHLLKQHPDYHFYVQRAAQRCKYMQKALRSGPNPMGFYRLRACYGGEGCYLRARLPGAQPHPLEVPAPLALHFTNEAAEQGLVFRHGHGKEGLAIDLETAAALPFAGQFHVAQQPAQFISQRIAPAFSGGILLADLNSDGYLDLVFTNASCDPPTHPTVTPRAFLNVRGRFVEQRIGLEIPCQAMGITGADFNRDGNLDIYLTCLGKNKLFWGDGQGHFTCAGPRTKVAGTGWNLGSAVADFDRDGHLDIFVPGFVQVPRSLPPDFSFPQSLKPAPCALYHNQGQGTFTNSAPQLGLTWAGQYAVAAYPLDFDHDHDMDLIVLEWGGRLRFWANQGRRFTEVTTKLGPKDNLAGLSAAIGDLNGDGLQDILVVGPPAGLRLYLGTPHGAFQSDHHFQITTSAIRQHHFFGALLLDIDNDSDLDVFLAESTPNHNSRAYYLLINNGAGIFRIQTSCFQGIASGLVRGCVALDVEGDGDLDLVLSTIGGPCQLLRQQGQQHHHWQALSLQCSDHHSPVGSQLLCKQGERVRHFSWPLLSGYLTSAPQRLHLGLGNTSLQALLIAWPDGSLQSLEQLPVNRLYQVHQRGPVGPPRPALYTWKKQRAHYRNDIGSNMLTYDAGTAGILLIPPHWLAPPYSLSLVQQRAGTFHCDQFQLLAFSHRSEYTPFLHEGALPAIKNNPAEQQGNHWAIANRLILAKAPRAVRAWEESGKEMTRQIAFADAEYIKRPCPYTLLLALGDCSKAQRIFLILKAAALWSEHAPAAPTLELPDGQGGWRPWSGHLSIPVGLRRTVIVDLTGQFQAHDYRAQLRTPPGILWDQILVATEVQTQTPRPVGLKLKQATFRWLGFPRIQGWYAQHFPIYDYQQRAMFALWENLTVTQTSYGSVASLVACQDNRAVVMTPGEELYCVFEDQLPPLAPGWQHSFILRVQGQVQGRCTCRSLFPFIAHACKH